MERFSLGGRRGQRFWSIFLVLTLFLGWWAYSYELNQSVKRFQLGIKQVVLSEFFAMAEWSETSLIGLFAVSLPMWSEASAEPTNISDSSKNEKNDSWGSRFAPDRYLFGALPLLGQMPVPKIVDRTEDPVSRGNPGPREEPPLVAVAEPDAEPGVVTPDSLQEENPPVVPETEGNQGALVVIYTTHNAETYHLTDGVDHIHGGQGGVVKVAEVMEETLKKTFNIPTARSTAIHDDNWLTANPYSKSAKTLATLLKDNPGTQIVIDVHRDAKLGRENSKVEINGETYAKVMLVVGTGERAPHPNWQQNMALAEEVGDRLEAKYPGIFRRVLTKPGRYNQHMHPGALLVEVGSTDNSLEEAVRSGEAVAKIIGEMMAENRD